MKHFTKQQVWFSLFVLAVFLTGAGAGLTLARFVPPGPGLLRPWGPPRPGGPDPAGIVTRMSRDLGLDAAQQEKLKVVFANAGERFARFRLASQEQFEMLRRQLNAEIEAVLTEEQRVRFRLSMPRGGPVGPGPGEPGPRGPAGPPVPSAPGQPGPPDEPPR